MTLNCTTSIHDVKLTDSPWHDFKRHYVLGMTIKGSRKQSAGSSPQGRSVLPVFGSLAGDTCRPDRYSSWISDEIYCSSKEQWNRCEAEAPTA